LASKVFEEMDKVFLDLEQNQRNIPNHENNCNKRFDNNIFFSTIKLISIFKACFKQKVWLVNIYRLIKNNIFIFMLAASGDNVSKGSNLQENGYTLLKEAQEKIKIMKELFSTKCSTKPSSSSLK